MPWRRWSSKPCPKRAARMFHLELLRFESHLASRWLTSHGAGHRPGRILHPNQSESPNTMLTKKTCVMKVKLDPNKTYGYWINSQNFHGFKDQQGHSAVPYLLVFKTKDS